MPVRTPPRRPVSVIGIPQKPCVAFMERTEETVCVGERTTGSVMKPFS